MPLRICSLASGSSGNATWISSGPTSVLVDCGPPAREVEARLAAIGTHPSALSGILITHAHTDHYKSAGTLHARYGVPIYIDPATARAARRRGQQTSWKRVRETAPIPDRIGDLEITPLDTQHGFPPDEGRTLAFVLQRGRKRVAVATDLGIVTDELLQGLRGVDAILIEANHDRAMIEAKLASRLYEADRIYLTWVLGEYGHLSNQQCAEALESLIVRPGTHVLLGHLSINHHGPSLSRGERNRDNNSHELAETTVRRHLEAKGVPMPHLHRTYRIRNEGTAWGPGPGPIIDV